MKGEAPKEFKTLLLWEAGERKQRRWRFRRRKTLRLQGEEQAGICDFNTRTIALCTSVPIHRQWENLIHEVLHVSLPTFDEVAVQYIEDNIVAALEAGGLLPEWRRKRR